MVWHLYYLGGTGQLTRFLPVSRKQLMGECNKEQSFALLDEFYRLGGNFIDTYVITTNYITVRC